MTRPEQPEQVGAGLRDIEAVVFDFDGTLVHTDIDFAAMREGIVAHLRQWDLTEPDDEEGCYVYSYEAGGELHTFKYDKSDNLIEMHKYDNDGDLIHSYIYNYNTDKKLESYSFTYNNITTLNFLDEFENIIKILSYRDNELIDTKEIKIDYELDEQGNWIKQVWYNADNEPEQIIKRTIIYYID